MITNYDINIIKITISYCTVALEHNGMVTISLLNDDDDEQVDAIKEKKNYENLKVLKTNETTEEELSCGNLFKQNLFTFFF